MSKVSHTVHACMPSFLDFFTFAILLICRGYVCGPVLEEKYTQGSSPLSITRGLTWSLGAQGGASLQLTPPPPSASAVIFGRSPPLLPVKAAKEKENNTARYQISVYIICHTVLLPIGSFDRQLSGGGEIS